MEYLGYGLGALLILYALGLGFALLLLPSHLRSYSLIIAPWIGYSYGTLAYFEVYELGGRISPQVAQIVLLPPLICLIAVLFTQGFSRTCAAMFSSYKVLAALSLAALIFVFLSLPVLWSNVGPTTVTLFNYDVAHYAAVSRFFVDFTKTSSEGLVGQSFSWFNEFQTTWAFGPTSSAAFLGVYLGIMPDQDTTLCINLFSALGSAGLFLVLYDTFKLRTTVAFLGIVLIGFHPASQYIALEGFFAQVIAMGLTVMIFWAHSRLVEPGTELRLMIGYQLLVTFFTFGLLLSYQQMLPFIWFFTGIHAIAVAWSGRTARPIWISATGNLLAFAAFGAFCFPRFIAFVSHFKNIVAFQAGWPLPFFSPDYLAGISYQNSPFAIEDPKVHLVAAIAVSTVAFLWIVAAVRKAGARTIGLWIGCCVVYSGSVYLAFHGEDGQFGGYKSFKMATYFLPFFVTAFLCLWEVPMAWTKLATVVKAVVLVSVLAGYIRADTRLLAAMKAGGRLAEPQFRDLLQIDRNNQIDSVNILGPDGWNGMWAAYFLMHKKLYMEYASYWGKSPTLEGSYDLQDNKVDAPIRHLPGPRVPPIQRLNDRLNVLGPFPKPEPAAP